MSYSCSNRWNVAVRFASISFFAGSSASRCTVDNGISSLFSYLCCTSDVSMTRFRTGSLNASSRRKSANLLRERLPVADIVDDRLICDAADVLHVIMSLGRIGLLLRISGIDVRQNRDATRGHSLRNVHYRKSLRERPPSGVSALCSCTAPPL